MDLIRCVRQTVSLRYERSKRQNLIVYFKVQSKPLEKLSGRKLYTCNKNKILGYHTIVGYQEFSEAFQADGNFTVQAGKYILLDGSSWMKYEEAVEYTGNHGGYTYLANPELALKLRLAKIAL